MKINKIKILAIALMITFMAAGIAMANFVNYDEVVDIDVKPGIINPNSKGQISVAILGTPSFDVVDVDPDTVTFGPDSAEPLRWAIDDVNLDGYDDLVFKFWTQATGIEAGEVDIEVIMTGELYDGRSFAGSYIIATVPPTP